MRSVILSVSSAELCILASWFLSPMSKNSVSDELRVRRLAFIMCGSCASHLPNSSLASC